MNGNHILTVFTPPPVAHELHGQSESVSTMYNPVSTFRVQFHKGFTFNNFKEIIPYLYELGVQTIYASPVLQASPGSIHGYDGVDPLHINTEIGTEEQLMEIHEILRNYRMGWVQDIAPNHMAFHKENAWLMDVLIKGRESEYADFFDILWESSIYGGRIMVPFEGSELASLLRARDPRETNYKICSWQKTDTQINYRRFFIINDLISLNIQYKNVFDAYHYYIKSLLKNGIFQGLRIDHIDGLYDPATYLENVRMLGGNECFIVVEKILGPMETIPRHWPIQGNTGYDFLRIVNNLFTQAGSRKDFKDFYEILTEDKRSVEEQTYEKKAYILYHHMQGELDNLYNLFCTSLLSDEQRASPPKEHLKEAIGELLIRCPVYRYYGNSFPLDNEEKASVNTIFEEVIKYKEYLGAAVDLLKAAILIKPPDKNDDYNKRALHFYRRCMQFSGPLMAKGVEDTLMYTYNAFIGHNEVGDSPSDFGLNAENFHHTMQKRLQEVPLSLNATSTHDTKRGEDVRARLNVLTDLKDEWFEAVESWYRLNSGLQDKGAPDTNDEYLIYQSLVGTYPMPGEEDPEFMERFKQYLVKALREAKRKSTWAEPDEAYEHATLEFATGLLDKKRSFWNSFATFHKKVADHGIINSLSQTILKFTCPGTPDIYQGCDLWDLSFVDPDNRRPIDYTKRKSWLDELNMDQNKMTDLPGKLWLNRFDGRIKLWLVHMLLQERKRNPELYHKGEYIPVEVSGEFSEHLLSFIRRLETEWVLVAIPLNIASLGKHQHKEINNLNWGDTKIILPEDAPGKWKDVLFKKEIMIQKNIPVKILFQPFPFAVLSSL